MIFRRNKIFDTVFEPIAPGLTRQRDGKHLMVWGDIPYWTVIDEELFRMLERFDGHTSLSEVIESNDRYRKQRDAVAGAVMNLRDCGVLHSAGEEPQLISLPETQIENIAIHVTRNCNFQCATCYNSDASLSHKAEELSAQEIIAFLDSIDHRHLAEPFSLSLLGGEPLLEPEKTLALARYAQQRKCPAIVSTNGSLITDDFARRAAECRLQVQVSIDGATPEEHDAVRGSGSFEKAVSGVRTLVRNGVYTLMSMVVHHDNLPSLKAFYELALRERVNEARFIPLKCIGRANASRLEPADPLDMIRQARRMFRHHPEFKPLTGRDALSIMATACRCGALRHSCGTGRQAFLLDADGTLHPCLNLNTPDMRFGNIRDKNFDFDTAWQGSAVLDKLRAESDINNKGNACSACAVRHWCLGGCKGETLRLAGQINQPAHDCSRQREAIVEVLWMLAETPEIVRPSIAFEQ